VKAQYLTVKEREKYFISLYVKEGAVEEKIPYAERRASLKPGTGQRILQRKKVQKEIKARMEPVRLEQMRQKMVGDAAAVANEALQNALTKKVAGICQQKIDVEILEDELMRMVVGLDQNKHPKAKLEAIIAAYVVNGKLESGNTRLVIPAEGTGSEAGAGMYTSLFNRLALNAAPGEANAQPEVSYEVRDLYPTPKGEEADSPEGTLPPSGESIDDPPTLPSNPPRVITVEVG